MTIGEREREREKTDKQTDRQPTGGHPSTQTTRQTDRQPTAGHPSKEREKQEEICMLWIAIVTTLQLDNQTDLRDYKLTL